MQILGATMCRWHALTLRTLGPREARCRPTPVVRASNFEFDAPRRIQWCELLAWMALLDEEGEAGGHGVCLPIGPCGGRAIVGVLVPKTP